MKKTNNKKDNFTDNYESLTKSLQEQIECQNKKIEYLNSIKSQINELNNKIN